MLRPTEVEIRILLENRKKIERKIKSIGARAVSFLKIKDYWYCLSSAKSRKHIGIDRSGFALRVRELKDLHTKKLAASLNCKTLYDKKTHALCNEYEVVLPVSSSIKKILESIGMREFLVVEKERIVYKYKNINFCFDKIKGIGNGLEIEVMAKGNPKETQDKLIDLAVKLGIKRREILKKSLTYLAMEKLSNLR